MNLEDSSISSGRGFVSESEDDDLYQIHGIAIGNNDVTRGHLSGTRKLWRPDVLEAAARTLSGKQLVVDHENRSSRDVVGEITEARYDEDRGVIYQGVLDDDQLASKIGHGWLDVSPRIVHSEEMDELEQTDADVKVPQEIYRFDNLSIVSKGAAKSNELNLGAHEELMSVEELQSAFESEGVAEYQQRLEELQDGVDLSEWYYESQEGAEGASQGLGCSGSHKTTVEGDVWYMPCDSHDQLLRSLSQSDEMADPYIPEEGDIVRWQPDSEVIGRVSHNDEDRNIAMVTLVEITEDGMEEMGVTFTAGYDDLLPASTPEEMSEVEEMIISDARAPEYEGTEEQSWGDISAGTLSYFVEALDYSDVEQVDDLTDEQKTEIAQHSLLGDPNADTVRGLRMFPVVNASTGNLNRGALEAVRSGRGQSADIPEGTYRSAYEMAGRLLQDEFDSDIEVEMGEIEEMSYHDQRSRIASMVASYSELTKDEAVGLMDSLNPNENTNISMLSKALVSALDSHMDESEMYEMLVGMTEDSEEEGDDEDSGLRNLREVLSS